MLFMSRCWKGEMLNDSGIIRFGNTAVWIIMDRLFGISSYPGQKLLGKKELLKGSLKRPHHMCAHLMTDTQCSATREIPSRFSVVLQLSQQYIFVTQMSAFRRSDESLDSWPHTVDSRLTEIPHSPGRKSIRNTMNIYKQLAGSVIEVRSSQSRIREVRLVRLWLRLSVASALCKFPYSCVMTHNAYPDYPECAGLLKISRGKRLWNFLVMIRECWINTDANRCAGLSLALGNGNLLLGKLVGFLGFL
jgi:hypothetical protein